MPSFVVHGLIPLLVLLAIRRLDARKVWILWPLTFVPDLDYFVAFGLHRAATGNVFILLPFLAGLAYSYQKQRPELRQWMAIAIAYLASHLVMDVFTGGSVLLWPLTDYTYCYYATILVTTATNTPYLDLGACSREGIPQVAEVYPWLGYTDSAILSFVLPVALLMAALQLRAHLRQRRASPAEPTTRHDNE